MRRILGDDGVIKIQMSNVQLCGLCVWIVCVDCVGIPLRIYVVICNNILIILIIYNNIINIITIIKTIPVVV